MDACPCEACRNVGQLRIKAILHYGEVALKRVRRFEELAGAPVIAAQRLLKNGVNREEYLLATEAFEQAAGGLREGGERRQEQCEGIGPVPVVVFDPSAGAPLPEYRPTPVKQEPAPRVASGLSGAAQPGHDPGAGVQELGRRVAGAAE